MDRINCSLDFLLKNLRPSIVQLLSRMQCILSMIFRLKGLGSNSLVGNDSFSTDDEDRPGSREESREAGNEGQDDSSMSSSGQRMGRRSSDITSSSRSSHRLGLNLKSTLDKADNLSSSKHLTERSQSLECSNLPVSPSCESISRFADFCIQSNIVFFFRFALHFFSSAVVLFMRVIS